MRVIYERIVETGLSYTGSPDVAQDTEQKIEMVISCALQE